MSFACATRMPAWIRGSLPMVAGPVLSGAADLVLGSRQPVSRGAWPLHARLANRYLARRMNRVMGRGAVLTDLGPMRAARRADLLALGSGRPPLRLPLGNGAAGRAGGLAHLGGGSGLPAAHRVARR